MSAGQIMVLESDAELASSFSLMHELRPQLDESSYMDTLKRMRAQGYMLAGLSEGGALQALAGYRVGESLAWGRFFYIDDLVSRERSKGHGRRLFAWLEAEARRLGCAELHLDSGTQRHGAHRFYLGQRMDIVFFHFRKALGA
jgi:GNAT superfamily N-acetyltransferase